MTPLRTSVFVIALFVGFAAVGPASAAAPAFTEAEDHLSLSNGFVTVAFQDKRPDLTITPSTPAEGGDAMALNYRFTRLVEYRDLDGNGAPGDGEVVASLDLARAMWNHTANGTASATTLTFSHEGPVKLAPIAALPDGAPALPVAQQMATIALAFTLADAATTLDAVGVDATVPATALAYELQIVNWPFVNANLDRLALVSVVEGDLALQNATGLDGGDVAMNGTAVGALAWSPLALGNTTAGALIDVPVKAVAQNATGNTTLSFTYDAADLASFTHEATAGSVPTTEALDASGVGVATEGLQNVPAPGVLLVAVGVGALALLTRRK